MFISCYFGHGARVRPWDECVLQYLDSLPRISLRCHFFFVSILHVVILSMDSLICLSLFSVGAGRCARKWMLTRVHTVSLVGVRDLG